MTIKLAIFDFDGTLADSYAVFAEAVNVLAQRHGFRQVQLHEQQVLRGMSARDLLRELHLPPWKVPAVMTDFRTILQQRIHDVHPFPGVVEALHALLDKRMPLALATSNTLQNVTTVLGDTLISRFATVECGTSLFGKSHRLRRILKHTRMISAEAIYVGDEIRDAEAANDAGIMFGAVAWGYTTPEALLRTRPERLFRMPADMLELGRG
ncbi:MAG TPA: HAD hydrolase-like protein [Dyella sp.]|uniref:HAD hydrolase-like protein n=1 Tax=Dyella sp. TaxID=1869338 RepID=UPI002CFA8406|nr:HAD hydrolase-like protein [Dyella sp.]HUB88238.1 HAD hydrolase-like protein [Dyella sp.]